MDDDKILMVGALTMLGLVFWWRNQQGLETGNDYIDEGLESLGETMTTIANKLWTPPAAAKPYLTAIKAAEQKYGLPENLLARLLQQESRFRQDIITGKTKSPAGAVGIAQFMPNTAKQYGVNSLDPFSSIDGAGRYLRDLYKRFGKWSDVLASYNWGQGNMSAFLSTGLGAKGQPMPKETKNYFSQILADLGMA